MFQMVMKSGRVNLSLWAGPLLLASFLTSESLPDLGLIEIGQGRRLKKDISDKAQWKRGTLRFRGDPRLSADVVHPELGFLPEDIQWLQGTLDDDYLWASSVPKIPGKETLPKNLTVFQPGRSDPAFFPDQDYWIHILFKNVPEELSQNLVHDLTSRLERAHEFAFKRRRDLYPGIGQVKVIKREITNNVAVTMLKISKETEDEVEAAYSLRRDGKPVLSRSAVIELNDLTDPELDFIFYPYALERLTSERRQAVFQESPESSHMAYVILGVVGAAMFVAFLVALMFFVWMKGVKTGEEEETQRGRKNRRVESGELKLPVFEEHQVARVDLGFEPGESDDGKPQKLTSPTRQSTDSVEVLISSTSEEKRPKVPPRSKRIAALPRNVASEEDSVDADVASVRNRSKPPERPKSSYRGAIISDVPSSSTTAVKPVTDRGLQIVPDARDVCVGDSKVHVVTEEDGEEGILKMRQRFHDMLDDAFRAFGNEDLVMAKVEVNSGDLPPPLPEKRARSAADSRANFDRPEKARPISALLKSGSTVADGNVLTLTVPPKPAWGTDPRFDVDVQASSGQFVRGRSNAPPPSPEMMMGDGLRNYEPIDPDSGLRMNDPAVPVIKAIKEELKRFDSTPAEKSSSKRVYRV